MKHLQLTVAFVFASIFIGNSQTKFYTLEGKNLHKKVRKTIQHCYKYDEDSGGFVLQSVYIDRFNDDENLVETYSLYNGVYTEDPVPVKKLYNYNSGGLLVSTKDISSSRGKYSTEYRMTYDNDGNLIKQQNLYEDGTGFYTSFENDRKGRPIVKREFNKDNQLTAEIRITYNGDERIEKRTSFNAKDGSIYGTYTTYYEDDLKQKYVSENKYGTSTTTYEYDKEGNEIASNYTGKTSSRYTKNYEYDKRDNWVKYHSRSGQYQYFYFREIHYDNGDVTGSTEFDPQYINRYGNFRNVNVVPLKKKQLNTNTNTNTNNNTSTSTNSSYITSKNYDFDYVYTGEKVKSLKGNVYISTTDGNSLNTNSKVNVNFSFAEQNMNLSFTVTSYVTKDDRYEWVMKNEFNEYAYFWIYKQTKRLKAETLNNIVFSTNAFFKIIDKNNVTTGFYLK